MSKAFGGLFGSSPKPVQQRTAFETLPGFAREAFKGAVTRGVDLADQPALFEPAALTGLQEDALATLGQGLSPITAEQFQAGLQTFQNPFEEQVVQSTLDDLRRSGLGVLSDIGSAASGFGAFGGDRQRLLQAELGERLARSAGDVAGKLRSQGFQKATERTLANLQRPQAIAEALFPLADLQRQIQFGQQQAPLQAVDFLSSLAGRVPAGGGQTTFGGGSEGILGGLGQLAGGTGGLIEALNRRRPLGSAFPSDKELKTDIEHVGERNGFNIYEFAYKWNRDKRYRGVIAQEVKEIMPEAIIKIKGYLAVNYAKLGFSMEAI